MSFIHTAIDWLLHLDKHLETLMLQYQKTTYLILCLIIFCETGLVATPFLPGDSLLFAAGAITAKTGILDITLLIPLLFVAAILGDNTNYIIGRFIGTKLFEVRGLKKILKHEYLTHTHEFYEKYGGKTIILARFIPIIRTFAPFVAGVGTMKYSKYILFCIIGGITWVTLLTYAGYKFGSNAFVSTHFELVVLAIIVISLIPAVFQFVKMRAATKKA
jgi:membrane-associated protein